MKLLSACCCCMISCIGIYSSSLYPCIFSTVNYGAYTEMWYIIRRAAHPAIFTARSTLLGTAAALWQFATCTGETRRFLRRITAPCKQVQRQTLVKTYICSSRSPFSGIFAKAATAVAVGWTRMCGPVTLEDR